jgi:hypothetical protein
MNAHDTVIIYLLHNETYWEYQPQDIPTEEVYEQSLKWENWKVM